MSPSVTGKRPLASPPPPSSSRSPPVITSADAFYRSRTSKSSGRGATSGWTACPLCPPKSSKRFALGRGIAAHLHAVHTPWKLGKVERKRREAARRRKENERRREGRSEGGEDRGGESDGKRRLRDGGERCNADDKNFEEEEPPERWDPSPEEEEAWGRKVAEIAAEVEREAEGRAVSDGAVGEGVEGEPSFKRSKKAAGAAMRPGVDRNGRKAVSYRDSLPPFIKAASLGDVEALRRIAVDCSRRKGCGTGENEGCIVPTCVENAEEITLSTTENSQNFRECDRASIIELLETTDRNGSTAEHWAAGGGHLNCLKFILDLRREVSAGASANKGNDNLREETQTNDAPSTKNLSSQGKKVRRRDGKTSLHYAARNGHDNCVDYLLSPSSSGAVAVAVDATSGDGTTPLHMACYGGHPSTVRNLVSNHGADAAKLNEWGCGASHWAAMSINANDRDVVAVCDYLKWTCGVDFHVAQRQGHTALHKAAQRRNRCVVEWLHKSREDGGAGLSREEKEEAGKADDGGNKPSDIWLSFVGGDGSEDGENREFGTWMRDACGW